ncbi:MAG: beta-galactosidase, partial [Planctomycetota bacterium]|nr:beta-galactosidase [Planctomycetota bacterium]
MRTFRMIVVSFALVCALFSSPAPSVAAGPGKACVVMTPAGPVLEINSKPTAPAILQTGSMDDLKPGQVEVGLAGKHGLRIVSPTVWGIPWFKEGQTPTLKGTDVARWLDAVVAANPDALLLPRFPVDQPPEWWIKLHPDEMGLFHDGTRRLASAHSLIWRRDAARQIGHFVRLLEARYGAHMIGYHVCGQNTAEWFYEGFWEDMHGGFEPPAAAGFRRFLKARYANDQALSRAWGDPKAALSTATVPGVAERMAARAGPFRDPASQRRALDFDEFRNADLADAVAAMCKAVKDAAPNRLAIAFYGYTFELSGSARGGHLALGRLLESPYVDGLCGPCSYADRQSGGAGRFMGPVDSVLAHGKMWFTEDDTRTDLTPADAVPGRCKDARETHGVLARNFAHAMAHGAGLWWMDMTGTGWFAREDIWTRNGALAKAYQASLPGRPRYAPEIAVVVDERSCLYANPVAGESGMIALLSEFRSPCYRIGAPLGYYLLDDVLAGRVPQAKLYIMLNAFRLDDAQRRALRERVCNGGRTVVWMYAPGLVGEDALREAGAKQPICGTGWFGVGVGFYPELYSNVPGMDYIDRHHYYGGGP